MKYFVINLKAYKQSTKKNFISLIKIIKKFEKDLIKKKVVVIICPNHFEINELNKKFSSKNIWFFSQSCDEFDFGAYTGKIPIHFLSEYKIRGTLINHSENKISFDKIKTTIEKAKKMKIKTIICCSTFNEFKKIEKLKPNFIAYEPKNLIGGDISVSTSKPQIIQKITNYSNVDILVGAGVKTKEDIEKSIKLKAKGILASSGIVLAKNKSKTIKDFIDSF